MTATARYSKYWEQGRDAALAEAGRLSCPYICTPHAVTMRDGGTAWDNGKTYSADQHCYRSWQAGYSAGEQELNDNAAQAQVVPG